jgi:predicted nucleic acid-binding OB-fold protein
MEHKSKGKSLEETQRKFVEAIVDVRIKAMMQKFEELEDRVERLERSMKLIYEKIDQNMKNVNR